MAFLRAKKTAFGVYVQLVESRRIEGKPRQKVIATLPRGISTVEGALWHWQKIARDRKINTNDRQHARDQRKLLEPYTVDALEERRERAKEARDEQHLKDADQVREEKEKRQNFLTQKEMRWRERDERRAARIAGTLQIIRRNPRPPETPEEKSERQKRWRRIQERKKRAAQKRGLRWMNFNTYVLGLIRGTTP